MPSAPRHALSTHICTCFPFLISAGIPPGQAEMERDLMSASLEAAEHQIAPELSHRSSWGGARVSWWPPAQQPRPPSHLTQLRQSVSTQGGAPWGAKTAFSPQKVCSVLKQMRDPHCAPCYLSQTCLGTSSSCSFSFLSFLLFSFSSRSCFNRSDCA